MTAASLLEADHRTLERFLEAVLGGVAAGANLAFAMAEAAQVAAWHYQREARFLDVLERHEPVLAHKMRAQHSEALELAAACTPGPDLNYLARRFCAIAQHNIIEEERDVFPLAGRCFTPAEMQEISRALDG